MKRCAKCGEICGDTSKFCSNCGASLADAEVVADDITGQVGEALEHALDQMIPPLEEEARIAKEKEADKKPEITDGAAQPAGNVPEDKKDLSAENKTNSETEKQGNASDKKKGQPEPAGSEAGAAEPASVNGAASAAAGTGAAAAAAGLGMAAAAAGSDRRRRPAQNAEGIYGQRTGAQRPDMQGGAAAAGAQPGTGAAQQGRRPARPPRQQGAAGASAQTAGNGRPRMPQGQPANGQAGAAGARGAQNPAGQQPIGTIVRRTQGMPGQPGRPMTPVRPNPTVQTIRNAARGLIRSPLFILYTLAGLASIGLSIARQFLETINLSDIVTVMKNFGASEQVLNYANQGVETAEQMGRFSIVPVIIGHLPVLLILLGAIVLICTASRKKEEMPTTGFTMIKAGLIIQMVLACIVIFIALIAATALTVTAWISTDKVYFAVALLILILAIVISMMVIMYYFSLLHTRKAVMRNAAAGEDYSTVSGYAAVICILTAVLLIVPLLYEVVNNQTYGTATIGCTILVRLLLGIWILYYRGRMEKVIGE